MQKIDNQISLPIIRSLKYVELEKFTVLFITETFVYTEERPCLNIILFHIKTSNNSEPIHYSVPYTIL